MVWFREGGLRNDKRRAAFTDQVLVLENDISDGWKDVGSGLWKQLKQWNPIKMIVFFWFLSWSLLFWLKEDLVTTHFSLPHPRSNLKCQAERNWYGRGLYRRAWFNRDRLMPPLPPKTSSRCALYRLVLAPHPIKMAADSMLFKCAQFNSKDSPSSHDQKNFIT